MQYINTLEPGTKEWCRITELMEKYLNEAIEAETRANALDGTLPSDSTRYEECHRATMRDLFHARRRRECALNMISRIERIGG